MTVAVLSLGQKQSPFIVVAREIILGRPIKRCKISLIGGQQRVTMVFAFDLFIPNFWKVEGLMNDILSVCECSLSSQYTDRWWGHFYHNWYNQIHFELLAFRGSGDSESLLSHHRALSCPHAPRRAARDNEPPSESFTTY